MTTSNYINNISSLKIQVEKMPNTANPGMKREESCPFVKRQ